jgi:hypothetical protein
MDFFLIFILLLFSGIFYCITVIYPREVRLERIQNREGLSPQEFYEKFYKDSEISEAAVADVLKFIKLNLALPTDKLRPYDRFDREYASMKELEVIDSDLGYFWDATHQRLYDVAKRKNIDLKIAFKQVQTLDEYIRTFIAIENGPSE